MPAFQGSDFQIELPAGCTDESTYAFALPARSSFRPSMVIKTERLSAPVELPAYVETQLQTLRQTLPEVELVSKAPAKHGDFPAFTLTYDWGQPAQRVRQKQRYVMLTGPLRVVSMTGTNLRDHFDQTEALFDAMFRSWTPKEA